MEMTTVPMSLAPPIPSPDVEFGAANPVLLKAFEIPTIFLSSTPEARKPRQL
jgi:hypothetical protein